MDRVRKKIGTLLLIFSMTIAFGVVGYHTIMHWSFFDSLYMTVITLGTVGYGETHPLDFNGKLFTIVLILGGMGTILYCISEFTAFIIEGEIKDIFLRRRMLNEIKKVSGHFIVCGAGKVGKFVIEELIRTKRTCVIVDSIKENLSGFIDRGQMVIEGDATKDETLLSAGIERAAGLITTVSEDKDNLFIVISAKGLNPDLRIISQVEQNDVKSKFIRAGACSTVSPQAIGGLRLASELIRPDTVTFLDTMLRDHSDIRFEDLTLKENSPYVGKMISDFKILNESGIIVVCYKEKEKSLFDPSPDTIMKAGCSLVIIASPDRSMSARELLNP